MRTTDGQEQEASGQRQDPQSMAVRSELLSWGNKNAGSKGKGGVRSGKLEEDQTRRVLCGEVT